VADPRLLNSGQEVPVSELASDWIDASAAATEEPRATRPAPSERKAQPFVKWVGGKRSLMGKLVARIPGNVGTYYEPFVGGGALFFEMAPRLKRAVLSDLNVELIIAYTAVRDRLEELLAALRNHASRHSSEHYYQIRGSEPLDPVQLAAWLLYVNKAGYNGLFRVNRQNGFNVPFGRNPSINIVQEENLRACNGALQKAKVRYQPYSAIDPSEGDFVYFDPPYAPTTDTSFLRYQADGFSEKDQQQLADFATKLHRKGVRVMLSNSDTPFVRRLYAAKHFDIASVEAPRMVNCKPDGRGGAAEVIVTNY
jgi:DNA adenine methylase